MINETNNYEKVIRIFFNFLLIALGVITFVPLLKVGLVHAEDVRYYLIAMNYGSWKYEVSYYATYAGRFYFLIVMWIYYIPYLIDAQWYLSLMRVLPILINLFLIFLLVKRLNYKKSFILFLILFCFATFQITGAGSAVTSYPFYFSFALVLVLCSLHLILSYIKTQKYYYIILSSIIMAFASLFQESFLMYYIFIFFFLLTQYDFKTLFKKNNILKLTKELAPYILFGIIYLVIYFNYESKFPSQYVGNQIIEQIEIKSFLDVVLKLMRNSCP